MERVEIAGELLGTTDKAVNVLLILADGTESKEWLPRSQIADQTKDGNNVGMTIPVWLAEDRGIV